MRLSAVSQKKKKIAEASNIIFSLGANRVHHNKVRSKSVNQMTITLFIELIFQLFFLKDILENSAKNFALNIEY